MRDAASDLPRVPLLGTWVNKGKKKGRNSLKPRPLVLAGQRPRLSSTPHSPTVLLVVPARCR